MWKWVDRASWVIALVLFPAAIYQLIVLQRDQRRLAEELTKHPDVQVGLRIPIPGAKAGIQPNLKIPVKWQPDANTSDVVRVPLSAVNVGARTAHNVLINLIIPRQVKFVQSPAMPEVRDEAEFDRWRLIFREQPTLHIGVTIDLAVSVQVDAGLGNGFPVLAEVSTEDRPHVTSVVFVGYE
jgi:hypothetical protein